MPFLSPLLAAVGLLGATCIALANLLNKAYLEPVVARLDGLSERMKEFKGELKSDLAGVKSEVAGVKSEVAGVKSDVNELRQAGITVFSLAAGGSIVFVLLKGAKAGPQNVDLTPRHTFSLFNVGVLGPYVFCGRRHGRGGE